MSRGFAFSPEACVAFVYKHSKREGTGESALNRAWIGADDLCMTFAAARLLALSALVLIGLVLGLACSREEPEEELDPYALAASPTPNLDVHIIITMEIAFATRVAGRELTPR